LGFKTYTTSPTTTCYVEAGLAGKQPFGRIFKFASILAKQKYVALGRIKDQPHINDFYYLHVTYTFHTNYLKSHGELPLPTQSLCANAKKPDVAIQ
jgi:hypothetical protein